MWCLVLTGAGWRCVMVKIVRVVVRGSGVVVRVRYGLAFTLQRFTVYL